MSRLQELLPPVCPFERAAAAAAAARAANDAKAEAPGCRQSLAIPWISIASALIAPTGAGRPHKARS